MEYINLKYVASALTKHAVRRWKVYSAPKAVQWRYEVAAGLNTPEKDLLLEVVLKCSVWVNILRYIQPVLETIDETLRIEIRLHRHTHLTHMWVRIQLVKTLYHSPVSRVCVCVCVCVCVSFTYVHLKCAPCVHMKTAQWRASTPVALKDL